MSSIVPPALRRLTFNRLALLAFISKQTEPVTRLGMSRALGLNNGLYRELSYLVAWGYVIKTRAPSIKGQGKPRGLGIRYHYEITAEGQRLREEFRRHLLPGVT